MESQEYSAVAQSENQDNPPQYQEAVPKRLSSINMPDPESCLQSCSSSSGWKIKIGGALFVVLLAITIACVADGYHKINEGNVGIYYKFGALQDRVSDPGVQFKQPFVESFKEVRIRPETVMMEPIHAVTKDGIENTFREITAITRINKNKLAAMTKKFGSQFKDALVFDRIKEELRIFCASHTIDEVYNSKFLEIVETVLAKVKESVTRLGQVGEDMDDAIEVLNLVIPKPDIPVDIAQNYKQVKVQWTEQLVATQQKKTEEIKKETELMKALADAERQKKVLEIRNQEKILEKEGEMKVSQINNEIKKAAEENDANIKKYKKESEAVANKNLYTPEYVQLQLANALANNTKFYFSGDNSALGSIFSKILNN